MPRELFKDVEVAGKKYRIEKFTAQMGSYICVKLVGKISGIALAVLEGNLINIQVIAAAVAEQLGEMPKKEFLELQRDALSVCKEFQMVGDQPAWLPVMAPDGKMSTPDLEGDIMSVMALTTHALVFNVSPFFDAEEWKGVSASFPGLNLQQPQT